MIAWLTGTIVLYLQTIFNSECSPGDTGLLLNLCWYGKLWLSEQLCKGGLRSHCRKLIISTRALHRGP